MLRNVYGRDSAVFQVRIIFIPRFTFADRLASINRNVSKLYPSIKLSTKNFLRVCTATATESDVTTLQMACISSSGHSYSVIMERPNIRRFHDQIQMHGN